MLLKFLLWKLSSIFKNRLLKGMSLYTSIYQLASNYYRLMANFVSSTLSSAFTSWDIIKQISCHFVTGPLMRWGLALSRHSLGFFLSGDLQVLDSPRKDSKDESEWEQSELYSGRKEGRGQGAGGPVRTAKSLCLSGRGPAHKWAVRVVRSCEFMGPEGWVGEGGLVSSSFYLYLGLAWLCVLLCYLSP